MQDVLNVLTAQYVARGLQRHQLSLYTQQACSLEPVIRKKSKKSTQTIHY